MGATEAEQARRLAEIQRDIERALGRGCCPSCEPSVQDVLRILDDLVRVLLER